MAKAFKADLTASTFTHSLKGYYFTSWLGRAVWKKSPANGFTKHPAQVWNRQQFGLAAQMVASPIWLDYVGALNASRGTEQVPRDILMMAAYGGLFTLTLPDGTTTTQANHSYVPPAQVSEGTTMIIAPFYDDAYKIGIWWSAKATKGCTIQALEKLKITRISITCEPAAGMSARITACILDGTHKITTIIAKADFTGLASGRQLLSMPVNMTIEKDARLTILLTRTDGSATYELGLPNAARGNWLFPVKAIETVEAENVDPKVGDTIGTQWPGDTNAIALVAEQA